MVHTIIDRRVSFLILDIEAMDSASLNQYIRFHDMRSLSSHAFPTEITSSSVFPHQPSRTCGSNYRLLISCKAVLCGFLGLQINTRYMEIKYFFNTMFTLTLRKWNVFHILSTAIRTIDHLWLVIRSGHIKKALARTMFPPVCTRRAFIVSYGPWLTTTISCEFSSTLVPLAVWSSLLSGSFGYDKTPSWPYSNV